MTVTGLDGSNSPKISSSSDHAKVASVEFDPVLDFAGGEFDFDSVADFAVWVGVSDGSAIVGAEEWDSVFADGDEFYSAEFVASFVFVNFVNNKSSFSIIDQPKVFVGLIDTNNIHESSWVFWVSPNFSVNFDLFGHDNLFDFISVQSIVKSVSDENSQRQAFSDFVGSGIGSVREYTASFWEHPMVGSCQGLEMFLWSTSAHFER